MVLAAFIWVLSHDMHTIRSKSFERSWGPLFEGLKLDSKKYLSFYVVFVLRRLVFFGLSIAQIKVSGGFIQIMSILGLNIALTIYIGTLMPMKSS